ncbi:MAG: hypothetical protein V4857_22325 [Pseudomonadota bacterium]
MDLKLRSKSNRFSSPTVLTGDTPFLGSTVEKWDKAFTGNMEKTLAEVKRRAEAVAAKRAASAAADADHGSLVDKPQSED